jgi:hypothetical protein
MKARPISQTPLGWRWPTWRLFKRDKRREIRETQRAFAAFRSGCAYIPSQAYSRVEAITYELEALRQELSEKEWGR